MRKAFTLIELIFVIIIIGTLTGVGLNSFKTNYLINDVNFVVGKIRATQYQGIGYSKAEFGTTDKLSSDIGCITLDEDSLNDKDFKIHATLGGDLAGKKLCFDEKGRPTLNEDSLDIIYRGKTVTLKVQALTGYVIITY